jgi:quercetin dioxygenase-like cupin family protein
MGYVLKGTVILKTRGWPDRNLKEGDTFFNARGAVHSLAAAPGSNGGAVISPRIADKAQPIAKTVP